jgi:UDP-N-acetyl-D-mannosaminuronate dehydrogenase
VIELMESAIKEVGKIMDNLKISIFGVSYKANTDDTRNTPTERIITVLKQRYHSHNIEYIAHDQYVKEKDYSATELTDDINIAAKDSDVLIFATNHKEYYDLDLEELKSRVKTPIIIDGRNIFDKKLVEEKGFIYRKVGEGSEKP